MKTAAKRKSKQGGKEVFGPDDDDFMEERYSIVAKGPVMIDPFCRNDDEEEEDEDDDDDEGDDEEPDEFPDYYPDEEP